MVRRSIWWISIPATIFALVIALGGPPAALELRYERGAVESGQLWRLLIGNYVHLGWWHLTVNLACLLGLGLVSNMPRTLLDWATRFIVLSLGVTLGIHWFCPQIGYYVGLSGILYGLYFTEFFDAARRGKLMELAVILMIIGRTCWDLSMGTSKSEEALIGGVIIPMAHLFGLLGGLAIVAAQAVINRSSGRQLAHDL